MSDEKDKDKIHDTDEPVQPAGATPGPGAPAPEDEGEESAAGGQDTAPGATPGPGK